MLGTVVADTLFGPDVDPTGQIIRIRNQPFKVIGVMTSKGQGAIGQDQDDTVFAPYTTVQKKLQGTSTSTTSRSRRRRRTPAPVAAAISEALRVAAQAACRASPDDFMVRTQEEMASVRTETTRTMTTLLAAIAGVSLLVGGIGIMNIMLVSVTERTREIGLRLAIGARGKDVLLQFLVEAIVISLFGGLLGIGLGFGLSAAAERVPAVADLDSAERDRHGVRVRRGDRRVLRVLSGAKGGAAGPDRGAAVRVSAVGDTSRQSAVAKSSVVVSVVIIHKEQRMKRARVGIIAAAVLAVATVAFAQKPDFSGTWTLDAEASGGGGRPAAAAAAVAAAVAASASGRRTVKQTPTTLTIERTMGDNKVDAHLQARRHREQEHHDGPRRRSRWSQSRRPSGTAPSSSSPPRRTWASRPHETTQTWSLDGSVLTIETHTRAARTKRSTRRT